MALIECTECGKNFSDKAPACPGCGCPTEEIAIIGVSAKKPRIIECIGIMGSTAIIDGDNIHLKAGFSKETCPICNVAVTLYNEPTFTSGGLITLKSFKKSYNINFYAKNKESFAKLYNVLLSEGLGFVPPPVATQPPNAARGALKCPKCKGHNIDLWANDKNIKTKQQTSININPLKPLTLFNTKEKKKEKKSAAKVGLAIMTGGASAMVTGLNNKKHNEYYCRDCGNRWTGK